MAKQVLLASRQLNLPSWSRTASLRDLDGKEYTVWHVHPEREWAFDQAAEEVWMDGLRPDVVLRAESVPPLLVEIRVTHAVDDRKANLVRSRGWAMLEIDLSKVPADCLGTHEFEQLVLADLQNRAWVHSPAGEAGFQAKLATAEAKVSQVNDRIRQQQQEERQRLEREAARQAAQVAAASFHRQQVRRVYWAELERLEEFQSREVIADRLGKLEQAGRRELDELCNRHFEGGRLPEYLAAFHQDAWIVEAHPILWQLALLDHFVFGKPEGAVVNVKHWVDWLEKRYGLQPQMKRLWREQVDETQRKRRDGRRYVGRPRMEALSDLENTLVPSPWEAVRYFLGLLKANEVLLAAPERNIFHVDGPVGRARRKAEREEAARVRQEAAERHLREREEMAQAALVAASEEDKGRLGRLMEILTRYQELAEDGRCFVCEMCVWPSIYGSGECEWCGSSVMVPTTITNDLLAVIRHKLNCDPRVLTEIPRRT